MNKPYTSFLIILACFLQVSFNNNPKQTFLEEYAPIAVRESHTYKIPASIKLAQAIVETNWGTSELATKANNYFGIKCKVEWSGETYMYVDDDKNKSGKLIPSCFRAYPDAYNSWEDHSKFLRYRSFYSALFDLKSDDYIGWAKGLKKAGYATDPNYDLKLIKVIEQFDLYKYDTSPYIDYFLNQSSSGR